LYYPDNTFGVYDNTFLMSYDLYSQEHILLFRDKMRSLLKDKNGFAQYIGAVVSVLVVCVIGLVVYYKIAGSINGLPAAGVTAASNVNTTANSVFTLAPITALVLIAGIIIGAIIMFAGGGKKGM
jgi:hypothetical protein